MTTPNPLDTPHFERLLTSLTKFRVGEFLELPPIERLRLQYPNRVEAMERYLLLLSAFPLIALHDPKHIADCIYRRVDELYILLLAPAVTAFFKTHRNPYSYSIISLNDSPAAPTFVVYINNQFDCRLTFNGWGDLSACPHHLLSSKNYWRAAQLVYGGVPLSDSLSSAPAIKLRSRSRYQLNRLVQRLLYQAALLFIR